MPRLRDLVRAARAAAIALGAAPAALCLACAGPIAREPRVAAVGEAYAGAMVAAAPPSECVIDSPKATIDLVAVTPSDAPPFAVAVSKVHVIARPTSVSDAPVPVTVEGVIRFQGLALIEGGYAVKKPQVYAGGVLRVGRGSRLVRTKARGAALQGLLEIGGGVAQVEDVALPCSAMEVPAGESDAAVEGNPEWHVVSDEPVDMWSRPGWGTKLSFWPGLSFHRVDTRGDWAHLAVELSDGTAMHGWVKSSLVERGESVGFLSGGLNLCTSGYASHQIIGPAIVEAGTKVSATLDGDPWGEVTRATRMTIRLVYKPDGTKMGEIDEAPGIMGEPGCPTLANAYIPGDSFSFVKRNQGE